MSVAPLDGAKSKETIGIAILTGKRIGLTAFLYQRDRGYCIGMMSSRWWAKDANVCGAGGL